MLYAKYLLISEKKIWYVILATEISQQVFAPSSLTSFQKDF